jgi:arylsulfate sulfotransferase
VRQLDNGDLLLPETPLGRIAEVTMLGDTAATWTTPADYPLNFHDCVWTPHGTLLYLSDKAVTVPNFPSSVTDPNAPLITTNVDDSPVVEISRTNGALLHAWSPAAMLDPTRVTYLAYGFQTSYGVDNQHGNAVIEDPRDNSLIESLRDQNAVFKFSRDGQLKWILGSHANWPASFQKYLLTPLGTPFQWEYGQHAPELTPAHTLLVYDDGNDRADPFDPFVVDQANFSRGVEYAIDETNMTVSQVWDTTPAAGDVLFTPVVGDADWLPKTGNVLVTFGYVTFVNGAHPSAYAPNATMVRIREYTHDAAPKIVFDLSLFDPDNTNSSYQGYLCYRSDRVPDLYPHPARAVADLRISRSNQGFHLTFSADPAHAYLIQSSRDLQRWTDLGAASQDGSPGGFEFVDSQGSEAGPRFYRVVTE